MIEQRVRAGWQERISAVPGKGGFSQIGWEMVENDGGGEGEFLLVG